MLVDYISIEAAVAEWQSLTGSEDEFSKREAMKIADDAARKLARAADYEYTVQLLPVNGPVLILHDSVRQVASVALSCRPDREDECVSIIREIKSEEKVCANSVMIKLHEHHIFKSNDHLMGSLGESRSETISTHMAFSTNEKGLRQSTIASGFYVARKEQAAFGQMSVIPGGAETVLDTQPRYRVKGTKVLEFDRPDYTWAIVCAFGDPIGEDGFRMLPDISEAIRGVAWKIEEAVQYRIFRRTRGRNGRNEMMFAKSEAEDHLRKAYALLRQTSQEEWRVIVDGMLPQGAGQNQPSLGPAVGNKAYYPTRKAINRNARISFRSRR